VPLGTEVRASHARMGGHRDRRRTRLRKPPLQFEGEQQVGELALVIGLPPAVTAPMLDIDAMRAPRVESIAGRRRAVSAK